MTTTPDVLTLAHLCFIVSHIYPIAMEFALLQIIVTTNLLKEQLGNALASPTRPYSGPP